MKESVARKWIAALRSGRYRKGKFCLRLGEDCFCALGVLADLKGGHWRGASFQGFICVGSNGFISNKQLPPEITRWAGLGLQGNLQVTKMNDLDDLTFEQIAAELEKNWETM